MEQVHRIFGIEFAKNDVIFSVGNSLSSHTDNCQNNFLVLDDNPNYSINGTFGSPEKKVNFACICIIMVTIVICLLMEMKSLSSKLIIKMSIFKLSFV